MSVLKRYFLQLLSRNPLKSFRDDSAMDETLEKIEQEFGTTFTLLEEYDRGTQRATKTLDRPSRVKDVLQDS